MKSFVPCLSVLFAVLLLPVRAAGEQAAPADKPAVTLPSSARVVEKIFGLPGLPNLGRVSPTFYRGAQPENDGFSTLRAMGIRTVINLRLKHSERDEVEAAGMRSIEIPMNAFTSVKEDDIRRILAILADEGNHPVFLHCKHGKDRTGLIVALYRMDEQGWPKAEAVDEMEDYGFNGALFKLKRYIRAYRPKRGL